jgi:hypothetical protein
MFGIVTISLLMVIAFAAGSKQEESEMNNAKESAAKAVDSAKDAAAHTGNAVKEATCRRRPASIALRWGHPRGRKC